MVKGIITGCQFRFPGPSRSGATALPYVTGSSGLNSCTVAHSQLGGWKETAQNEGSNRGKREDRNAPNSPLPDSLTSWYCFPLADVTRLSEGKGAEQCRSCDPASFPESGDPGQDSKEQRKLGMRKWQVTRSTTAGGCFGTVNQCDPFSPKSDGTIGICFTEELHSN